MKLKNDNSKGGRDISFLYLMVLIAVFSLVIFSFDSFAGSGFVYDGFVNEYNHDADLLSLSFNASEFCSSLENFKEKQKNTLSYEDCDFNLEIISDDWTKEKIFFSYDVLPIEPENYTIEYWIEDYFGDTVRLPFSTKNTNPKQFTPNPDYPFSLYRIVSELKVYGCNNSFSASKDVLFIDDDKHEVEDEDSSISHIEINHIYGERTLKYGEPVDVKFSFSNTGTKDNVVLYVVDDDEDKLSDDVDFFVFGGSEATMTQRIPIYENCHGNMTGYVVARAFGITSKKEIHLECENPIIADGNNSENMTVADSSDELLGYTEDPPPFDGFFNGSITSSFSSDVILPDNSLPWQIYLGRSYRPITYLPFFMAFSSLSLSFFLLKRLFS
ncbi:MAG: hypothetical protein ACOCUR_02975 [Nanoarchaeota archaeon]